MTPDAWHRDARGRLALPPVRRPPPVDLLVWLAILVVVVALCVVLPARSDDGHQARVEAAMLAFCRLAPRHPVHRADYRHEVARALVDAGQRYDLDPLLLTTMAYLESSLRVDVVGLAGEVGLLQVGKQAQLACRGEDLATAHGQTMCGARWLARAVHTCGSVERALTVYACGVCWSAKPRCQRAVKTRLDVWRSLSE